MKAILIMGLYGIFVYLIWKIEDKVLEDKDGKK